MEFHSALEPCCLVTGNLYLILTYEIFLIISHMFSVLAQESGAPFFNENSSSGKVTVESINSFCVSLGVFRNTGLKKNLCSLPWFLKFV